MTPTLRHARARALVRLPDGRVARLVSIPRGPGGRSNRTGRAGGKARVRLASGTFLSVPVEDVEVLA